MEGYKTYTGVAIALIGLIASKYLTDGEIEMIATGLIQLVGLGIAVYGRYKAKK